MRDIDRIVREAEEQGWTVETTGGGHYKFIPPDPKKAVVITASSPSDWRAIANIRARLRRSGLIFSDAERKKRA